MLSNKVLIRCTIAICEMLGHVAYNIASQGPEGNYRQPADWDQFKPTMDYLEEMANANHD